MAAQEMLGPRALRLPVVLAPGASTVGREHFKTPSLGKQPPNYALRVLPPCTAVTGAVHIVGARSFYCWIRWRPSLVDPGSDWPPGAIFAVL